MSDIISRRDLIARGVATALAAAIFPRSGRALAAATPMLVYKDPNCGCCAKWVTLMRGAGFEVSVRDTPDMPPIKQRYKVPEGLTSCHTALVGGYVIEGHVPADLIHRLLTQKPALSGLAVPGMPAGSPGMEGGAKQAYDIVSFDAKGKTAVFARR